MAASSPAEVRNVVLRDVSAGPRYGWAVRDGDILIDNGYTTIDTATGLEWLDLTLTQGVSAPDVLAGFGGYIDAGWTFATVEQVCGLFGALGDDSTNCTTGAVAMQMNPTKSETLVNLLGNTAAAGPLSSPILLLANGRDE